MYAAALLTKGGNSLSTLTREAHTQQPARAVVSKQLQNGAVGKPLQTLIVYEAEQILDSLGWVASSLEFDSVYTPPA